MAKEIVVIDDMENVKSEIRKVSVSRILTDPRVQRSKLNSTRINKMIAEFDEHALGTVVLSERHDETFIALDGWHRTTVCKLVPEAPVVIDAKVFTGLTLEQEARYFRLYNARASMLGIDSFRVGAIEGQEEEVAITNIIEAYGLTVSANSFACVAAAKRIISYPEGYETLNATLTVIDSVWACERGALDWRIVEGIAFFLRYYEGRATAERLIKKLSEEKAPGYAEILKTAIPYRDARGGPVRHAVANVLAKEYNKGLHGENRLPEVSE